MSNPKNRKIQSIWYDSQSYKNYIAQLETEQKQIDESKKPNPNNLIKRIYSMDSGLITPVLFSLFWEEKFNITPIATYFDISTTQVFPSTFNSVVLSSFLGDRGTWQNTKDIHLSGNGIGGSAIYHTSAFSEDDGSGISKRIFLRANFTATVPDDLFTNASISFAPYYHSPLINKSIKLPITRVTFTANLTQSLTVTTFQYANDLSFRITFNGSNTINYYVGTSSSSPGFSTIVLTPSEFANFNRDVVSDYFGIYGVNPTTITRFDLRMSSYANIYGYGGWNNAEMVNEVNIDNIKIN